MSEQTIGEARDHYFRESGLPEKGGYEDKWIPLKFGWFTFFIYNSDSRKRAVKLHDIHHIVTGYKSDPRGEAEISAWELAAGIYDKHFARLINLGGLFYGAFVYPKTTFKAYVLGKHSSTLYDREFSSSLLQQDVDSLRKSLLPSAEPAVKAAHYIEYASLVALIGLPGLLLGVSLIGLVARVL